MKYSFYCCTILLALLPFLHGKILTGFGIPLSIEISGNFEFIKSIFFIIFTGVLACIFFIEKLVRGQKTSLKKGEVYIIFSIILVLLTSTFFSLSPTLSLIADTEKGHTFFLFFGLIILYIILRQFSLEQIRGLIRIHLITASVVVALACKELILPSFDYGGLASRALGTFGHPNHLSGYLLLSLPFIRVLKSLTLRYFLGGTLFLGIILTQSLAGVFFALLFFMLIYKEKYLLFLSGVLGVVTILGISVYFPEKLHSFISRYYLWETSLRLFFSLDFKNILFGAGLETLPIYFNSFKVPEMYIFENFGYSADRPHNIFLFILYHFGLFGISFLFFLLTKLFYSLQKQGIHIGGSAILLFFCYGIFHYFSIASFIILVLALVYLHTQAGNKMHLSSSHIPFSLFMIIGVFGSYLALHLLISEMHYQQNNIRLSQSHFTQEKILLHQGKFDEAQKLTGMVTEKNYRFQITVLPQKQNLCRTFTSNYPSVENYFFCGKVFEQIEKPDLAKQYYQSGLDKLPDLWNTDSHYWDNYFIKHTITGNRFFAKKHGNLLEILEKYGE